ncbi:Phosphate-selective porin O and P [Anatilimnocola aggregata]|uniref:Phosphate-selective porin O and P n=1 Tax=Anatilimnocola aggregata TaxID=2528021 RepID=A0A517YBQ3_9BACT|nr:porin [Anatilimnocola aggregata]QDU27641.1 Phosphate-selective porin O and P [Anatilimnocola aggregata]
MFNLQSFLKALPAINIALAMSVSCQLATAQQPFLAPHGEPAQFIPGPFAPLPPQPVAGNAYPVAQVAHLTPEVITDQPSMEQIMARLERAEAALSAMQSQQFSAGGSEPSADSMPVMTSAFDAATNVGMDLKPEEKKESKPKEKKWYDKLSIRGYAQIRMNHVTHLEPGSAPAQHAGDRSVGDNQNFLIRRARVIISGDVGEHTYVYLQPDFASSVPGSPDANHFTQIRDWYADCYLDTTKVHRFRVGQSKVPYGWENMQSSSNRLPLDRSDSLNSAVRNERDLGVFYYWTPEPAQDFFKEVLDEGLKGSGNYGVFGFGVYNGQGGSFVEQNDNLHVVARLTVPYQFDNCQMMEVGIQGYTGLYTVLGSAISPLGIGPDATPDGTISDNRQGLLDKRLAASFIWYPQPFGFQAEWNVGEGPALNDAQDEVIVRPLTGGYAMMMYKYDSPCHGTFIPFARYNRFKGGYKPERNAPYVHIDETEIGLEWQIDKSMELVGMYTFTNRTNTTAISADDTESYRQFVGEILRFQFQFNY